MKFTAIIRKGKKYWYGWISEIQGANSQGKTKKELLENLKEASKLIIEANREMAEKEFAGYD